MTTPDFAISNVASSPSIRKPALPSRRSVHPGTVALQFLADTATAGSTLWAYLDQVHRADAIRTSGQMDRSAFIVVAASLGVALCLRPTHRQATLRAPMNIAATEALLRGLAPSAVLLLCAAYGAGLSDISVLLTCLSAIALLLLQRWAVRIARKSISGLSCAFRSVLLYSPSDEPRAVRNLISRLGLGVSCAGVICDSPNSSPYADVQRSTTRIKWEHLEDTAREYGITEIVVADPYVQRDRLELLLRASERLNLALSLHVTSDLLYQHGRRCEIVGDIVVVDSRANSAGRMQVAAKRVTDLAIAIPTLVLALPVFAAAAIAIKLDSRGPVFFRQDRIGINGRRFRMWKFRSMRTDAPQYERSPLSDADPRLTRVGRLVRRLSIDELPQLLNVLNGDMSLVGPRPEMPFIVDKYGPAERQRLLATPGITGLWQISPARAEPIHQNMEYDLYYIRHQNFFLDAAILLSTLAAVARGIGAL